MLSQEFLIRRGGCCGHGCLMCPYDPKHTEGNNRLRVMWFRIKAYDKSMKRNIKFWLWGDSEEHIRSILSDRDNITDIEYIKQDTPDFID